MKQLSHKIYELTLLLLRITKLLTNLAESSDHNGLRKRLISNINTIKADCRLLYDFIIDLQQCVTEFDINFLLSEIYPEDRRNGEQ